MTPTRTVMEIEPVLLTVDHSVQRSLDPGRVSGIAKDFRREALGVIHVSQRPDGTHHIIDGQHRIAAIHAVGQAEVPVTCVLWEGLSRAEEAAMFRQLNNTRQVQVLDRFRVRVVEGDPVACTLTALLGARGWTVHRASARGSFSAVAALESVYLAGRDGAGARVCASLIEVATAAWGHDPHGLRAEIVAGLGALLRRHRSLDRDKLTAELAQHEGGPLGLIGKAKQLRGIRGGRISDAMAEILTNLHNKRRTVNRLPEWRST